MSGHSIQRRIASRILLLTSFLLASLGASLATAQVCLNVVRVPDQGIYNSHTSQVASGIDQALVISWFDVPDDGIVSEVRWQGLYVSADLSENPVIANATEFGVWIFEDNSGVPSGPTAFLDYIAVGDERGQVNETFREFRELYLGGDPDSLTDVAVYDYVLKLPESFVLTGGKYYWIGIWAYTPSAPGRPFWGWNSGSDGSDGTSAQYFGGTFRLLPGHRAFSLIGRQLSGPEWVDEYPASDSLFDLDPAFGLKVMKFLDAVTAAGVDASVESTYRSPERAYLMHWAWKIWKEEYPADQVPDMDGVCIDWWHGDQETSSAAAKAMVDAFGIDKGNRIPPALESLHTMGLAADIVFSWKGAVTITNGLGDPIEINSGPRNSTNKTLIDIGASYGVIHYLNIMADRNHWSIDGH